MHDHPLYAFLDSGIGGLPYYTELRREYPAASCVYLGDTIHFPYGTKTAEDATACACSAVDKLIDRFNPDCIIIACNTISVAALDAMRSHFSVPFVGTVPAIKLAAARSKNRRIGLLATQCTIDHPYTAKLITEFAADCYVKKIAGSQLIDFIENKLHKATPAEIADAVKEPVAQFKAADIDELILACTHFLHVAEAIKIAAGTTIEVIDSREGVVHQALRLVPPDLQKTDGCGRLYVTGGDLNHYKRIAEASSIQWGGIF